MKAKGRNPGKASPISSRMRFHTTTAGPGLHPGYNSTRSPDGGRRPESGKDHSHPFTHAFSHNHRRPRITSGLQQHPVARMQAAGRNPGKSTPIQSRQHFRNNHRRPRISLRSIRATKTGYKITCGHPANRGLNSPHGPIPAKFRGWRNLLFYGGAPRP